MTEEIMNYEVYFSKDKEKNLYLSYKYHKNNK